MAASLGASSQPLHISLRPVEPPAPAASLLSASLANPLFIQSPRLPFNHNYNNSHKNGVVEGESGSGGGGNFRRNLQIDMKDLVGDAVGNVSVRVWCSRVLT
jgi:hypothetical protein